MTDCDVRALAEDLRKRARQFPLLLTDPPQPHPDAHLMERAAEVISQQLTWREALVKLPAGVLCYVSDDDTAFFTTQPLEKQWGDDWNDAPYECNAGSPYRYREGISKGDPYSIGTLTFSGPFQTPADLARLNSRYSVQAINSGACAWLTADDPKCRSIGAGVTAAEFVRLIQAAGGDVYVPLPRPDSSAVDA